MKKFLSILLVLTMLMTFAIGCSKPADVAEEPVVEDTEETEDTEEEEVGEVGEVAKLGLGSVISIANSKDAGTDKDGKEVTAQTQADVTIAAVGFDSEDRVSSVTIDVVQSKIPFDEDLKVAADMDEEVKTKKDLGPEYGMLPVSESMGIGKEWFEQMDEFEKWMIGKTVDEILGLKVKERDPDHQHVPDIPELTSTVTITVESYQAAVKKAWENTVDVEGGETVGLGIKATIGSSRDYNPDKDGKEVLPLAQSDITMSAIALDSEGNVVGSIIDTAQVKIELDNEGVITTDREAELMTKHELEDDYGMRKASPIEREWFEQMNDFQDWMIGKTPDEIVGMPTKEANPDHPTVPDVPELTSTVTMDVGDYLEATDEAIKNAR